MICKFKKEFIETEVGKIIFYIRGDGPPVLLLHGYPQYSLMWEETALFPTQRAAPAHQQSLCQGKQEDRGQHQGHHQG